MSEQEFLYICSGCGELHTIKEWEDNTIKDLNREQRRQNFIPFESNLYYHLKKDTFYKCPSCQELISRLGIKKSNIDDNDIN